MHAMAGRQGGAPRVDEQQALVAQDAGVVHDERAGLLWEVAEADRVCGLPPCLQLCLPLLSKLVERPSHSVYNVSLPCREIFCRMMDIFVFPRISLHCRTKT